MTLNKRLETLEAALPPAPAPPLDLPPREELEVERQNVIATAGEILEYCANGWLRWEKQMSGDPKNQRPKMDQREGRESHFVYTAWYTQRLPQELRLRAGQLCGALEAGLDDWSLRTGEPVPDDIPGLVAWLQEIRDYLETLDIDRLLIG